MVIEYDDYGMFLVSLKACKRPYSAMNVTWSYLLVSCISISLCHFR